MRRELEPLCAQDAASTQNDHDAPAYGMDAAAFCWDLRKPSTSIAALIRRHPLQRLAQCYCYKDDSRDRPSPWIPTVLPIFDGASPQCRDRSYPTQNL
jgi:hypothetical protein